MRKSELEKYNGQNGNPAYIAYNGKVYDVTSSDMWTNGEHMSAHYAGMDLTDEIDGAPHDDEVLEKFKIVGELDD